MQLCLYMLGYTQLSLYLNTAESTNVMAALAFKCS